MTRRSLMWFRNDLRVADNPALAAARERGDVVAVYVPATTQWRSHGMGANRLSFLLRTLTEVAGDLESRNIPLLIAEDLAFAAQPPQLLRWAAETGADAIFCNDEYPLDEQRRDTAVAAAARAVGVTFVRCSGGVIAAPGRVLTAVGQPYTVFTPFKRRWLASLDAGELECVAAPRRQRALGVAATPLPRLGDVDASRLARDWPGGERAANRRLDAFVDGPIHRYHEDRDRPDRDGTSRLSAYLAVGSISARRCLLAARTAGNINGATATADAGVSAWINELVWRDFYAHVAAAFPDLSRGRAFRPANDRVAWRDDRSGFDAWQQGRTGYPLVDAAMRQLTATGWMHNRLRMLVAMFLTKHLLIDWRAGERHFMNLLVDGDFAANNGGWQWSASTGTDAAPYFRIFNPIAQARKFDPDGVFVRRWVPELVPLNGAAIFEPWRSATALDYPPPIVDHAQARERALAAFKR